MTAPDVDPTAAFQASAKRVLGEYEALDDARAGPEPEPLPPAQSQAMAAAEWDQVNAFRDQVERARASTAPGALRPPTRFTPIGYVEARARLTEAAAGCSSALAQIQRYDFTKLSCTTRLLYKVFGAPEFRRAPLRAERDAVFALAATGLAGDDDVHQRMLQSVYGKLTGQTEPCPARGSHWEVIGFQGQDPGTDLRGSGIFGLIQMLYFAKQAPVLLTKVFSLSRDERQNFPFAIVSLNFTGICLKVLREARIYRLCTARDSVIDTICILYLALFYDMYIGWRNQGKTIESFPPTRDDIEMRARRDPKKLIVAYEKNNESPLQAITSPDEFVPE